jgi:hypothetical protein
MPVRERQSQQMDSSTAKNAGGDLRKRQADAKRYQEKVVAEALDDVQKNV